MKKICKIVVPLLRGIFVQFLKVSLNTCLMKDWSWSEKGIFFAWTGIMCRLRETSNMLLNTLRVLAFTHYKYIWCITLWCQENVELLGSTSVEAKKVANFFLHFKSCNATNFSCNSRLIFEGFFGLKTHTSSPADKKYGSTLPTN